MKIKLLKAFRNSYLAAFFLVFAATTARSQNLNTIAGPGQKVGTTQADVSLILPDDTVRTNALNARPHGYLAMKIVGADTVVYLFTGRQWVRVGLTQPVLDSARRSADTLYFRLTGGGEIAVKIPPTRVVTEVIDLSTYDPTTGDTLIVVSNTRTGGSFTWKSSGTADGGIVIAGLTGYWYRQMPDHIVQANWFGYGDTTANKAAISKAITATAALNDTGGVVQVPYYMPYNYSRYTRSRQLNDMLDTVNRNVTIIDYTAGSSYPDPNHPNEVRDGAQIRYYFKTKNQLTDIHDGNGIIMRAPWHPHIFLFNDGQNPDNRRASILFGNNGFTTWIVGQGTKTGYGFTTNELSSFRIAGVIGDSTSPLTTLYTILKQGGKQGWRIDPISDYHFNALDTTGASTEGTFRFSNGKSGNLAAIFQTAGKIRVLRLNNSTGVMTLTNDNASSNTLSIFSDGRVAGTAAQNSNEFVTRGQVDTGYLRKRPSQIFPYDSSYQAPPSKHFSNNSNGLEFVNMGNTIRSSVAFERTPMGVVRNNWSLLLTNNMIYDSTAQAWKAWNASYPLSCLESGWEGVTFHYVPPGYLNFTDYPHEGLQIRGGIDGITAHEVDSQFIQIKTTVVGRYDTAFDAGSTAYGWGYSRRPFNWFYSEYPTRQLQSYNGTGNIFSMFSQYTSTATSAPVMAFERSRGTYASKSAVQSGDTLGNISMYSYDGSGFLNTVRSYATATANATSNNAATKWTTVASNGNATQGSTTLTSGGNFGVNIMAPAGVLHTVKEGFGGAFYMDRYAAGQSNVPPSLYGIAARGTIASPAAVQKGDVLLTIAGSGHDGASLDRESRGALQIVADTTFSATAKSTALDVRLTNVIDDARRVFRIDHNGHAAFADTTGPERLLVDGSFRATGSATVGATSYITGSTSRALNVGQTGGTSTNYAGVNLDGVNGDFVGLDYLEMRQFQDGTARLRNNNSAAMVIGSGGSSSANITLSQNNVTTFGGAIQMPAPVATSGNLTLTGAHYAVRVTNTSHAITLPSASSATGRLYVLVNYNTGGNVTISSVNRNGSAVTALPDNAKWTVQSDGTNWYVIQD